MSENAPRTAVDWSRDVFREMSARQIQMISTVPDGGLTRLLNFCANDRNVHVVTLSTEPEGVGVCTGAWLGGVKAMLAMQSSGVGNCINALSMAATMRTPCLMLVTMRGQWGEFNPWQVHMGGATRPVLEVVGVRCFDVDEPDRIGETFAAAADLAFHCRLSVAVLVGQRAIGAKGFGEDDG